MFIYIYLSNCVTKINKVIYKSVTWKKNKHFGWETVTMLCITEFHEFVGNNWRNYFYKIHFQDDCKLSSRPN